jgi:hypothetical protein
MWQMVNSYDNILVFPTGERWSDISPSDRLQIILHACGFWPSNRLWAQFKIQPWQRGLSERYEFFDLMSSPPDPCRAEDSPFFCYEANMFAPAWIFKWYLYIRDEGNEKLLLLVYTPKRVFIKCRLAEAEEAIPAVMQRNTLHPRFNAVHGPIPPCPLEDPR